MHFTIDQEDAKTIFRLKERRLDSQNAGQLKAEFLILSQPDVELLIVDLTEVEYVDSAGLSALLLANRQMASHGGEVRLVGLNENVMSLLKLTQLDRVMPAYDTVEEAINDRLSSSGDDGSINPAERPLAPGAPSMNAIRRGAISAGGSLGAAELASIMLGSKDSPSAGFADDDLDEDDDDLEEDDDLDEVDDEAEDEFDDDEFEDEEPVDEDTEAAEDVEDIDEDLDDLDDLDEDDEDEDDDF